MFRIFSAILLIVFMTGARLAAQEVETAQFMGPRISLDHEKVDVGILERGVVKEVPFIITNKGDQPLKINDIDLSCGCLTFNISNATITPESKSLLMVKIATSILIGQFEKEIYLKTNDPSAPTKTLQVAGFSRGTVHADPSVFSFGTINGAKAETRDIRLYDMADFGLRIKGIETSSPLLQTATSPLEPSKEKGMFEGKKGFLIRVTVPPRYPLGELNEYIVVQTNLDNGPNLKIPVRGEVLGDITWQPSKLSLALVDQQTGRKRRIMIKSASGAFRVARVEHDEPFIDIVTYEKAAGNYVIVVSVIPDSPRGPFNDEVRVFEPDSPKPVVRIPVYGLVKGTKTGHVPASKPAPSVPIKLKEGERIEEAE